MSRNVDFRKQWRPRSDAAERDVWSGSPQFAIKLYAEIHGTAKRLFKCIDPAYTAQVFTSLMSGRMKSFCPSALKGDFWIM